MHNLLSDYSLKFAWTQYYSANCKKKTNNPGQQFTLYAIYIQDLIIKQLNA